LIIDVNNPRSEYDDIIEKLIKPDGIINEENYEVLKGKFYFFITSQVGSRVLQNCISKTNKDLLILIFNEIKDCLNELILNQYGNYFCQKFFSCLNKEYRISFLKAVR
jgi:hypothetical protein